MLKTKFKFGQEIEVLGYINRHKIGFSRLWVRFPFTRPIKAIFLGGRKLSNGNVEYENHGEDGGDYYFDPKEYLDGALVCQYNHNPIKVLLEDCK